ncbi:MAG TPA: 5-oxoprolinase subunit PxpA [Natrialbaceae archaeon]|nr:5-oxoprolinase subunit PxpA [Natrialbaceae archaeon]
MTSEYAVDLNCDLGEGFGAYSIEIDEAVMETISSANVAAGFHAGDPMELENTVEYAKKYDTAVGAHPGLPDLLGFGRRQMEVTTDEVRNYVTYQVGAVRAFCNRAGVELQHVKPHGALYNMASNDEAVATGIIQALDGVPDSPSLLALSGSKFATMAEAAGLDVRHEVFADRAYNPDGTLVSRRRDGAVIHDPDRLAERAVRMVKEGQVETIDGETLELEVDSICVHGDSAEATENVARLSDAFEEEGISIAPLREL